MLEHRFAIVTVFATFLLLLVGGTVNPTGSSLACPEPTLICHGSLFPEMTGGVLFEHGHRLVAMSVGLLQIGLTILLWRRRPSLRWLGVGALFMVCAQGALGAITVKYKLPWEVSTSHLLLAMCYLATLLTLAWRTRTPGDDRRATADTGGLHAARPWVIVAMVAVLAQILLGGLVRHHGAALASVDLPLHHGSLWPSGAPLALELHMAHRIGGVLVGLIAIVSAVGVLRAAHHRGLRRLAVAVFGLVALQITLGVLIIVTYRAVPVAVAHFGGAAALWGVWFTMFLVTGRSKPAPLRAQRGVRRPALAEGVVS